MAYPSPLATLDLMTTRKKMVKPAGIAGLVPMTDEQVLEGLEKLPLLKEEIARRQAELDLMVQRLLRTGRWGVRVKVAAALGVTPEAVRQKYGSAHPRMPEDK